MIGPVTEDLEFVVDKEVKRAKAIHGDTYHSPHEAYAVLREEIEEAQRDLRDIEQIFFKRDEGFVRAGMWGLVSCSHMDKVSREAMRTMLNDIAKQAVYAAAELVQVAAVCDKALQSLDSWKGK